MRSLRDGAGINAFCARITIRHVSRLAACALWRAPGAGEAASAQSSSMRMLAYVLYVGEGRLVGTTNTARL